MVTTSAVGQDHGRGKLSFSLAEGLCTAPPPRCRQPDVELSTSMNTISFIKILLNECHLNLRVDKPTFFSRSNMSGAEILFPLLSLSAAAYRAREVCTGAWYTVRLGRRVESIVSDLKVEETIYQAYRNHFALSVGLNPDQAQQRNLWCNASIRTALKTRLGSSKAHALLENLRQTQDSINDVYAISLLASQGLHVLVRKLNFCVAALLC